jgi:hypothetical protein
MFLQNRSRDFELMRELAKLAGQLAPLLGSMMGHVLLQVRMDLDQVEGELGLNGFGLRNRLMFHSPAMLTFRVGQKPSDEELSDKKVIHIMSNRSLLLLLLCGFIFAIGIVAAYRERERNYAREKLELQQAIDQAREQAMRSR